MYETLIIIYYPNLTKIDAFKQDGQPVNNFPSVNHNDEN